jgi:hypothetical protein
VCKLPVKFKRLLEKVKLASASSCVVVAATVVNLFSAALLIVADAP